MKALLLAVALAAGIALTIPGPVYAKVSGAGHSSRPSPSHSHSSHGSSHASGSAAHGHNSGNSAARGMQRNPHGRIPRSRAAKREFKKTHLCPSTGRKSGACPGYVIDHVIALKRGGADQPGNMQWQTTQAAKEKDKWE
jgi:hypothetical protein